MRLRISIFILLFALCIQSFGQQFIANNGQWKEPFKYKWNNNQGAVFLEENGLSIHLVDYSSFNYHHLHRDDNEHTFDFKNIRHHGIQMRFVQGGSNNWTPLAKSESYHNYFKGQDSERWQTEVPLYGAIQQNEIYKGIDIKYYTDGNTIKYDLFVEPQVNSNIIKMQYSGVDTMYLEQGFLIMITSLGELIEQKPIAWQISGNENIPVKCEFQLEDNTVSFHIPRRNKRLPLVIDPQYIFSTFSGSTADNFGFTACFDSLDNMYSGGIAFNTGYPITAGAFQDTFSGGDVDMAITKFNSSGTQLIYSTYIGGALGNEQPNSMVASNNGGLVIMGVTGSSDYPVSSNAFDKTFNGGPSVGVGGTSYPNGCDIVVTHLNSTGSLLLGSTFIGGSQTDGSNENLSFNYGDNSRGEVIYDSTFIHVASSTFSNDFMGGNWGSTSKQNGVLFSLNDDCSISAFNKVFLGLDDDAFLSLRTMRQNGKYFIVSAGGTKTQSLPTDSNSYQQQYGGGVSDGFILKYNLTDDKIERVTYNGTSAYDQNYFIEIDRDNSIYVFGQTYGQYPVTPATWAIANSSQFLHKFTSDLSSSIVSTVFGNNQRQAQNISPTAFMVDDCKNIYLSGWGGQVVNQPGSTIGLPTTPDARDSTTDGNDFYFMVLDGSWKMLEYASFFGEGSAEHVDGGTSRFSNDGTIFQAICAGCNNQSFPTFPANVYSHNNGSTNCNLGSVKIKFDYQGPNVDVTIPSDTNCIPYQLNYTNNSTNVDFLIWDFGDGDIDTGFSPTKIYLDTGTFFIKVIGIDTICQLWDTTIFPIRLESNFVQPGFTISPYDTCTQPFLAQFNNNTTGATDYIWHFGDGTTSTLQNPSHTYNFEGNFTVTMIAVNKACSSADTVIQSVFFKKPPTSTDFTVEREPCLNPLDVELLQLGSGFQYHIWDMGNGDTLTGGNPSYSYAEPGNYTVTLTSYDTICNIEMTAQHFIFAADEFDSDKLMANIFTPNNDGTNDFLQLVYPEILIGHKNFGLLIFNRWGDLVYSTDDQNFKWDGKFENKDLSEGVYFWILSTFDDCRKDQEYK